MARMTLPEQQPADAPAGPRRLHVHQKITPFQNVYRVFTDQAGEPGPLVAMVKQKRMALREQFTVFSDEAATQPVMAIKADRRIDIRSTMSVTDAQTGALIGQLRKKGASSLLRSTWEVEQPGLPVFTVTERSVAIALLRRFWGLIPYLGGVWVPWVFHFDGTYNDQKLLTHSRRWGIRDRYVLDLLVPELDWRLAVALAIVLDAMQKR
jgi:uncharacterized protein YxjI